MSDEARRTLEKNEFLFSDKNGPDLFFFLWNGCFKNVNRARLICFSRNERRVLLIILIKNRTVGVGLAAEKNRTDDDFSTKRRRLYFAERRSALLLYMVI